MAIDQDDLDRRLVQLFRSVPPRVPSRDFTVRAMRAVKRETLPAGRIPLRHPLTAFAGWAAVFALVSIAAWSIALTQPFLATVFATLLSRGIGLGVWLVQFVSAGASIFAVLTTTGLAIARALMTTQGSAGLALVAVVGALSLSALHRLLISEREEQWQGLS